MPERIPTDPVFVLLFIDPSRVSAPDRPIKGGLGDMGDFAAEPGALYADVRTDSGETVRVVFNRNSRVVLPGSTEPTAATGSVGDTDPNRPAITSGLRISGVYREFEVRGVQPEAGFPWRFVVRATISK